MKIAIHHVEGSFSDRWVSYCEMKGIDYKIVNCYDSAIIEKLSDCNALMWHFHHHNYTDTLCAKNILYAIQHGGILTFPNFNTCWHFDDKLGQKYLFESLGVPHIPTYIFYKKELALKWSESAIYPTVFKLRTGAGSANVRLVHSVYQAKKIIRRAFRSGFSQFNKIGYFKDTIKKYKSGNQSLKSVIKAFIRILIGTKFSKQTNRESGYVYFQDFVPNNDSDIRVIVIGAKAFAIKRLTRDGDFRASGSGKIIYDPQQINPMAIELSFKMNALIKSQCSAFDFVINEQNEPIVVEVSYGFAMRGYNLCPGYWDDSLNFHLGTFDPYGWMVDNLIQELNA